MKMIRDYLPKEQRQASITSILRADDDAYRQELRNIQLENNRIIADVPKRFQQANLNLTTQNSANQTKIYRLLKTYSNNFKSCFENGAGLILQGNVGSGKTHAACGLCNELIEKGYTVKFTTAAAFFRAIKSTYRRQIPFSEQQIIDTHARYQLLIIDEIDVGCAGEIALTDFERHCLFDVINRRYENMLPTIVITNSSLPQLKHNLSPRIYDRLLEKSAVLAFDWASLRGTQVKVNEI
ncbi:MAG: ATP-binding protein [Legionellales bacterium]|nr:ATP-binding protein [Legionellales bacterium]